MPQHPGRAKCRYVFLIFSVELRWQRPQLRSLCPLQYRLTRYSVQRISEACVRLACYTHMHNFWLVIHCTTCIYKSCRESMEIDFLTIKPLTCRSCSPVPGADWKGLSRACIAGLFREGEGFAGSAGSAGLPSISKDGAFDVHETESIAWMIWVMSRNMPCDSTCISTSPLSFSLSLSPSLQVL